MKKKFKTGIAFSDFVEEQTFMFTDKGKKKAYNVRNEILYLLPLFIFACIFIVLFLRLFYVQVVQGSYYKRLSDENRTRTTVISAPRGIIFDRLGRPLVRNVPVFEVVKKEGNKKKLTIVSKEEALRRISDKEEIFSSIARDYLYKDAFSHVIGYIGQISEEELADINYKDYALSDFIGITGLENSYEKILHGVNGKELYEVSATGEKIKFLGRNEPISGKNLHTTLNLDLQLVAKKALESVERGAVVVSNPRNGEILALYSKPSFDPNLFTYNKEYVPSGEYKSKEEVLMDSELFPLLNRAISGVYPPGSTYKLITSAAGLSLKKITSETVFEDTGVISVGGSTFGTWNYLQNGRKEGSINLIKGLQRSNDIYFYRVGEKLGVENLDVYSKIFGFGEKSGIDIPGEAKGTVPDERWKKRTLGENWYLGDTYNMSIGQGYLETTPLQVNIMTQIVANGGKFYKPHLVKNGEKLINKEIVSDKYLEYIRKGMNAACEPGGTAYPLFDFKVKAPSLKIDNVNYFETSSFSASLTSSNSAMLKKEKFTHVKIGCKTGTAEAHGIGKPKPHAWLTLFAPYNKPEVVVTVLVENGGEGSSVAAPIARDILREYFENK